MRKTRAVSLMFMTGFLAFSVAAWGQEKEALQKPAGNGPVLKVIPIKYAEPMRIQSLLRPAQSLPHGVAFMVDDKMKVLTVSGSTSEVEAVEEAVKKLDVPPPAARDVELTAYFLLAKREPAGAAEPPPALSEVVAELKKVLNYQGFTLLNTALIRTQDGQGGRVEGVAGDGPLAADFSLAFDRLNITAEETGTIIRLRNLAFQIWSREATAEKKPMITTQGGQERTNVALIHTDIDIPAGQKVVVGKTSFVSPDNAFILVLTAKVVE